MWSAFTPGRQMRATAEMSQSAPMVWLNAVGSAPRYVLVQVSIRGVPSHVRVSSQSRTGWMQSSRATAPTARLTTTGATLMPRSWSHSAVRMSSASSQG